MRKLFVLFLLISLVPFTVGCNGLWDFDDDEDVALRKAPSVKVAPKAVLPAAAVAPSIRAQQAWEDIALTYNGVEYFPTAAPVLNSDGTYTLSYPEITLPSTVVFTNGYATVNFVLNVAGQAINFTATVTELSTGSTATTPVTVTVSSSTDPVTGVTTLTIKVTGAQGEEDDQTQTAADKNYITSIKYGTGRVSVDSASPTTVNTLNPIFNVYFDSEVTTINSWAVIVTNTGSGNFFELNSTNNAALFEVTPSEKMVSVKVKGGVGKQLKAGATYKIEFVSGSVDGDSIKAANTRYIQTAAITHANTTLTNYTGKAADVPVADPQVITLTFSGNVTAEPTGTVKLYRYDNADRSDATPTSITINADTATYAFNDTEVTVTFDQAFVAGKYYTVKNETGVWMDANGNPIEGVSEINFATAAQ